MRAIQLAKTKWENKKITDKYQENISDNLPSFHPMKPTDYEKYSNAIQFPAFLQPKIDGVRMFSFIDNGQLKMLSRQSKPIVNIDHVEKELKTIFDKYPDLVLDGELLIGDKYEQKDLRGVLKKKYIDNSNIQKMKTINYNIFDVIERNNLEETFENRWKLAKKLQTKNIKIVPTSIIHNKKEIDTNFNKFISEGYEGAIIRNGKGKYRMGKQSQDLQKIKLYFSDDFIISGFHEGTGNEKGTVIWEVKCLNNPTKTFRVRPMGTREEKRRLFLNVDKYIGKKLKIYYYEKDTDGCVTRVKTAISPI
jgi:ATP-dependent DNA ligase